MGIKRLRPLHNPPSELPVPDIRADQPQMITAALADSCYASLVTREGFEPFAMLCITGWKGGAMFYLLERDEALAMAKALSEIAAGLPGPSVEPEVAAKQRSGG